MTARADKPGRSQIHGTRRAKESRGVNDRYCPGSRSPAGKPRPPIAETVRKYTDLGAMRMTAIGIGDGQKVASSPIREVKAL